jgi:hypothetical protein
MSLFREVDGVIPPNWFQNSADRVLRDDGCEINFGREIGKKLLDRDGSRDAGAACLVWFG